MAYGCLLGSRMLTGALIGACLAGASGPAQAAQRFFTIAAVEPKGGTTADKEPFPTVALPEGGGYVIKKPDQTGRWEVSAYVWQPSQIIVTEGDDVTLDRERQIEPYLADEGSRPRAGRNEQTLRLQPFAAAQPNDRSAPGPQLDRLHGHM